MKDVKKQQEPKEKVELKTDEESKLSRDQVPKPGQSKGAFH